MLIFEDNQGAVNLTENPSSSSGTKHIDVRHPFRRQSVRQKVIEMEYVPTEHQLAHVLTKPLDTVVFRRHAAMLLNLQE
ncbi:unnamed protein product [Discosporangium mesarthrocarpum]